MENNKIVGRLPADKKRFLVPDEITVFEEYVNSGDPKLLAGERWERLLQFLGIQGLKQLIDLCYPATLSRQDMADRLSQQGLVYSEYVVLIETFEGKREGARNQDSWKQKVLVGALEKLGCKSFEAAYIQLHQNSQVVSPRKGANVSLDGLTPRQKNIVEQVALGKSRSDVAKCLSLSESCINEEMKTINRQTGMGGRLANCQAYWGLPTFVHIDSFREKFGLSLREADVLHQSMIVDGLTEISQNLNISYDSVGTIRGRIYRKLSVSSVNEAYSLVMQEARGLINRQVFVAREDISDDDEIPRRFLALMDEDETKICRLYIRGFALEEIVEIHADKSIESVCGIIDNVCRKVGVKDGFDFIRACYGEIPAETEEHFFQQENLNGPEKGMLRLAFSRASNVPLERLAPILEKMGVPDLEAAYIRVASHSVPDVVPAELERRPQERGEGKYWATILTLSEQFKLSSDEAKLVNCVMQLGAKRQNVADELGLQIEEVKVTMTSILRKLRARDFVEVASKVRGLHRQQEGAPERKLQ